MVRKFITCAKEQSFWLYAAAAAATVVLML